MYQFLVNAFLDLRLESWSIDDTLAPNSIFSLVFLGHVQTVVHELGVVANAFNPSNSGGRGSQISKSSRSAWSKCIYHINRSSFYLSVTNSLKTGFTKLKLTLYNVYCGHLCMSFNKLYTRFSALTLQNLNCTKMSGDVFLYTINYCSWLFEVGKICLNICIMYRRDNKKYLYFI